jgi:hypothetical protein
MVRRSGRTALVDGNGVIYHYLQKWLLEDDIWLFQMLTARLVTSLGVWLPVAVYQELPLLLPFAVRDPTARGDRRRGRPEAWGSPNPDGYFRDDNTLIKAIPRSLPITSALPFYQGRRLGRGFTAAHVWQHHADEQRATRHPLTYSFVANLVWLPTQVALLTDRTGSFVPAYLQAAAHKLYRHAPVAPRHRNLTERAWELLPIPEHIPQQGLPDPGELNFFQADEAFMVTRLSAIRRVRDLLGAVLREGDSRPRVSGRYNAGIDAIPEVKVRALRELLDRYLDESPRLSEADPVGWEADCPAART